MPWNKITNQPAKDIYKFAREIMKVLFTYKLIYWLKLRNYNIMINAGENQSFLSKKKKKKIGTFSENWIGYMTWTWDCYQSLLVCFGAVLSSLLKKVVRTRNPRENWNPPDDTISKMRNTKRRERLLRTVAFT